MNDTSHFSIKEIRCKSALNRINSSWLPYRWDLNLYRGCGHGCKYCFAVYTHDYIEDKNFFKSIHVKINAAEQLERQLSSPRWKKDVINLGGVTDNYQPVEKDFSIMPDILKVLIKYKNPAIISTKSDLILRDFDLFDKLSRLAYVNIAFTITTVDEEKRMLIEPMSSSSEERFRVLKEFQKTNASTGLHCMPILPYITDAEDELDELLLRGKEAGISYAINSTLNLRSSTRKIFFSFIRRHYPSLYNKYLTLYNNNMYAHEEYRLNLRKIITKLKIKHSIANDHSVTVEENAHPRQMTIEDFIDGDIPISPIND